MSCPPQGVSKPALSAPLPAPVPDTAQRVGEDDIRFQRGPRAYRVRGLARNLSAEVLKVTLRFYRNVFSVVSSGKVREVAAMLKAIHAAEDIEAAQQKAEQVVAKLRQMKWRAAADKVEAHIVETFAYYAFPETHWRRIRTHNPLERMMREIRRRTRVVGAFPDGQAALMLAAARLRYLAGMHWGAKRYLGMEEWNKRQALTTVAA